MKVLVYGAGGSQQFPVIAALRGKGAQVIATTHSTNNLAKLEGAGATAILADMSDGERLKEISEGVDAISFLVPFFLANPMDGLAYAKNVIDAAVTNNVKLLVWNTSGFILPQKTGNPALDVRIDILDYLKNSGLPHISIQPSVYTENLLEPWTVPFVKRERKVAYPTPEDMPIGWIATKDVAALVAEAIFKPELAGSSFLVSGLENINGSQLAQKFTMGLAETISYFSLPPKDFGRRSRQRCRRSVSTDSGYEAISHSVFQSDGGDSKKAACENDLSPGLGGTTQRAFFVLRLITLPGQADDEIALSGFLNMKNFRLYPIFLQQVISTE
jgi:uncharacterized protein YbjT (DUF2867 family)